MVDVPVLGMLFDSEKSARDCFEHFKRWAEASESGDAVGIGFIEFENNEYGMCIYQDVDLLIARTIPETIRPEVDPIFMFSSYIKIFPEQSRGYAWFKNAVTNSPFLLAPSTPNGPLLMDLVIQKRNVSFYKQSDVPEHSPEGVALRSRASGGETDLHRPIPESMKPRPQEVTARRRDQLRRFFPVTLERMSWNPSFSAAREHLLNEGFREWQLKQAWCNRSLRHRYREDFDKSEPNVVDVLIRLVNTYDTVATPEMPLNEGSIDILRGQIRADTVYLLASVLAPDQPDLDGQDVQVELSRCGFMED